MTKTPALIVQARGIGLDVEEERCDLAAVREAVDAVLSVPEGEARQRVVVALNDGLAPHQALDQRADGDPHFASQAQMMFTAGDRVFDLQLEREGVYLGRIAWQGDVALVWFDGDKESTEMSFYDLRQLYR